MSLQTGAFSAAKSSQYQAYQFWASLCRNLGNSYKVGEFIPDADKLNTIIGVKNYALTYLGFQIWAANYRLTNQFIPKELSCYLQRWENIFGLLPAQNATMVSRRQTIGNAFLLWNQPPTFQGISDQIDKRIPDIFLALETRPSTLNDGYFPGGLVIPGGVTLADGPWTSPVNRLDIRVWQPTTHDGYTIMSDNDFQNQRYSVTNFLLNYLPTYVEFQSYRYFGEVDGCMTVLAGSIVVLGNSTNWETIFEAGDTFQSVDDNNTPILYTIASVDSDTQITLTEPAPSNNTCGIMQRLGFILDQTENLGNDVFD